MYHSERKLKAYNQIANIFLTIFDEEMYSKVLKVVLENLESKHGIFGYINQDDGFLVVPSLTRDVWDQCNVPEKNIIFPRDSWVGLWGHCLKEKKILYFNGPFNVPKGHIPIKRFLCGPIIYQDKLIGLLAVGNKKTDYNEKHAALLEGFVNQIAPVLHARLERDRWDKERKEAEAKLKKSQKELRNLSAYLQSAREKERTRVAREIHDELGQMLTALKMTLAGLTAGLPQNKKPLLDKVKKMSTLIDTSIQTVQRISSYLRPSILDNLGIIPAIKRHTREFETHTGIKSTVIFNSENIVLDQERSTAIFRIFQEALTNVARHSNATTVETELIEEVDRLVLTIKDNGRGITRKEISSSKSFGIIGMRERSRFVRGEIKISSSSGLKCGTTVTVFIPLSKQIR